MKLILTLFCFLGGKVFAENFSSKIFTIDEPVVVLGSLLKKNSLEEASSTTVLTTKDLIDNNLTHLEELAGKMPNFTKAQGASRARFYQMRGIGERSDYQALPNASVGFLYDYIDYSGLGTIGHLDGVSQLEIYRGPQATSMGPGALAGMVFMRSQNPSQGLMKKNDQSFHFKTSLGSFNTHETYLGGHYRVTPHNSWAINVSRKSSEGFVKNSYQDNPHSNALDETALTLHHHGEFKRFKLNSNIHFFNFNNGYDAFSFDNSLTTHSDRPGYDRQLSGAASFHLESQLSEKWKMMTIATALNYQSHFAYDEDWGNNESWNQLANWQQNYDYAVVFDREREDFTLDQRLVGSDNLIVGIYLKNLTENQREESFKNGNSRRLTISEIKSEHQSLYAEKEDFLNDFWSLNYGARIERRSLGYENSQNFASHFSENLWGGKLVLNHYGSNDDLHYLKISRGYKAGGVNPQSNVPLEKQNFLSENLVSLELGLKKKLTKGQLEAFVFYMARDQVQVTSSEQQSPDDPNSYVFFIDNATSGENKGLETSFDWLFLPTLQFYFNLGLLQTRFGHYELAGRSLTGRQMPHAPQYQGSTGVNWSIAEDLSLRIELEFQDAFYFANSHDARANASQFVNVNLNKKSGDFDFYFSAKNLFNQVRQERGFFFSNEPPDFPEKLYYQRGIPLFLTAGLRYRI